MNAILPDRRKFSLWTDPDYRPEECPMEFRLTYEGELLGASRSNTRARHKHEIRKRFHTQLKQYWQVHPYLREAPYRHRQNGLVRPALALRDYLARQYGRLGYRFVPLITENLSIICGIEILFLRPGTPGEVVGSGDIDNRLKTIFDALRMPVSMDELGGYDQPGDGEDPFFCLLTDDKLIAHVSVETDTLLEPTSPDAGRNDARLIIRVRMRPYDIGWDNLNFA